MPENFVRVGRFIFAYRLQYSAIFYISLVPRLSFAPRTKNSILTSVEFLGPRSNCPAGICASQSHCAGNNLSRRDNRMSHRRVTITFDPCSNFDEPWSTSILGINTNSTLSLVSQGQILLQSGRKSGSVRQPCDGRE